MAEVGATVRVLLTPVPGVDRAGLREFMQGNDLLVGQANILAAGGGTGSEVIFTPWPSEKNMGVAVPAAPLEIFEEIAVLAQFDPTNLAARDDDTVHMDRIGRSRRQDDIPRSDRRQG